MASQTSPDRAKEATLRLTEIFYSIQGESSQAGRPCVFVRLSRCNLRCTWCDTTYSFTGGTLRTFEDILDEVRSYGSPLVEITGGEPLLQKPVFAFMTLLADEGFEVLLETSGSIDISQVDPRVLIIMDLKPPGSGEVDKNLMGNIDHLKPTDEVKFVLLDEVDYRWAIDVIQEHDLASRASIIFSPVHGELDPHLLSTWILRDRLPVRLGLQLHKYLDVE